MLSKCAFGKITTIEKNFIYAFSKVFNASRIFTTHQQLMYFKDTHRKKAPSNKTPALRKSKNMGVWAVGTSNQLFIGGS